MQSIFFYHAHNGFPSSVCRFSCIRDFVVFAAVCRSSENIKIHLHFVSVCKTVMTSIRIFLFYLVNVTFSFFFVFTMKNIPDKSWSFDFGKLVFQVFFDCFVEEFQFVEGRRWKVEGERYKVKGERSKVLSLYNFIIYKIYQNWWFSS